MSVLSPQGKEQSKSCYTCCAGPTDIQMREFMLLVFNDGTREYNVPVYIGKMYTINYYNTEFMRYDTVTGYVAAVNDSTIVLTATVVLDEFGKPSICSCGCGKDVAGYVSSQNYYIPAKNIISINLVDSEKKPVQPEERCETIMAVLGISSTVVRAVIIRLKIYDDSVKHCVTPVDMEVGKHYHMVYVKDAENHGATYELDGKLIRIEDSTEELYGDGACECGFVRPEQVGYAGNTYDPNHFYSLDKFNPEGERIKLVFDTSKDFCQLTDTVMLKDIRYVKEIPNPIDPDEPLPDPDLPDNPDCGFFPPFDDGFTPPTIPGCGCGCQDLPDNPGCGCGCQG